MDQACHQCGSGSARPRVRQAPGALHPGADAAGIPAAYEAAPGPAMGAEEPGAQSQRNSGLATVPTEALG